MRLRTAFTYLSLLPLSACTNSCQDYDNNEEFSRATLPAYTETGAGTLGCILGARPWTVLGSYYENRIGYPWEVNRLEVDGRYSVTSYVRLSGRMTGVRNSKAFYDMGINLTFLPTDTLGGLHLLGADTSRTYSGRFVEHMSATNFMNFDEFHSRRQRPVRLLVRKLDRQRRIISGTFAGVLYGGTSGRDSLAVTDGRFDLNY